MASTVSIGVAADYVETGVPSDTVRGMSVVDAAYLSVQSHPGGVATLARAMGVKAGTLQHKLNPANDTHHLTLCEAVRLQVATGNASVLHAMASQLGYECRRALPDLAEGDPVESFMRFQTEVAEVTRAAADSLSPDVRPSRNAVRRLDRHVQELTVVAQYLARAAARRLANTSGGGNAY